jgi:hypothetical protein
LPVLAERLAGSAAGAFDVLISGTDRDPVEIG